MIELSSGSHRGVTSVGTATVYCHFPFADWDDQRLKHWGRLRIANTVHLDPYTELRLQHEESMEILTFVYSGSVTASLHARHLSDLPTEPLLKGDLHYVSAGERADDLVWTAAEEGVRLVQFWLLPEEEAGVPESTIRRSKAAGGDLGLTLLASGFPDDSPESGPNREEHAPIQIKTYARLMYGTLGNGYGDSYKMSRERRLFLQVLEGQLKLSNLQVISGDSAMISDEESLLLIGSIGSEFLLIDTD